MTGVQTCALPICLNSSHGEVALEAGAPWRFDSFTQDDYRTLYEDLRTSVLKVDAYSDLDTLPETPNVTVNRLL